MLKLKQIFIISNKNFRLWRKKPAVFMAFALGFIIAFMLSNKVVEFSTLHNTQLQFLEVFIWTFGDSVSIMLVSLCLLLLFSDVPSMDNDVPFFLVRTSRIIWILGQIVYVIEATIIFAIFIMMSTCLLSSSHTYLGNIWSETAAILGYSTIGEEIAVPAFVKVLEFSFPYQVSIIILFLIIGYSLLLSSIIFCFNLFKAKNGMIAGVIFSGFGFFLTPEIISKMFNLNQYQKKLANILFGWMSPLNHATYYMHNFGYDQLPRIWQSYLFYIIGSLVFFGISIIKVRNYSFNFSGTER